MDTEVHSTWNRLKGVVAIAACAALLASCSSSDSYQTAALRASPGDADCEDWLIRQKIGRGPR